jgi:hypothetical protein
MQIIPGVNVEVTGSTNWKASISDKIQLLFEPAKYELAHVDEYVQPTFI